MALRLNMPGFVAAGFLATMFLPGCGGGSPTSETAAVGPPRSEVDYQKQQEQSRKEKPGRPGARTPKGPAR